MAYKRVIPCLDVSGGRVVKGRRFRELQDQGDPVELARGYADQGADELVFLDIDATPAGRDLLPQLVARVAREVDIPFTVGGGVRRAEDVARLVRAGADKVAVQTAAVDDPELITRCAFEFGSQCVVLAIDARRTAGGWELVTHGGRRPRGMDAVAWAREAQERGAGEILLTSIDADGGRSGYDLELTRAVSAQVSLPVIASGGAGGPADMAAVLTVGGADAALAASILHQGGWTVGELRRQLREAGVEVRP